MQKQQKQLTLSRDGRLTPQCSKKIKLEEENESEQKENCTVSLSITSKRGIVTVAKYRPGKPPPQLDGYKTILIHTSGKNIGGDLSPYVLKNEDGHLLENIWQFSKVYARVTAQRIPLSRFHPNTIVWDHPAEEHVIDNIVQPAYWKWREKGRQNSYAVRYPNGFHGRHNCLFSLWLNPDTKTWDRLDYIEARKRIYCGEYSRLAPRTPHFAQLRALLENGTNLLIAEVDGPDPTLNYPPYDSISLESPALQMNETTAKLLVEDPKKPFGHGFVIACLLQDGASWML